MRATKIVSLLAILTVVAIPATGGAQQPAKRSFNLGYFEAGPYATHSLLRREFYDQLELILPEGYQFVTIPQGFRSADWMRDTCRIMARQLADEKSIDILIAMGPWVVHDLLKAGFDRPIIAMHQFDPGLEGLLDESGRPIVSNLTVHSRPVGLYEELTILSRLIDIDRLGVLYFPSANELDTVVSEFEAIGKQLGFEVVSAEGYNIYGTFAYFKAFNGLEEEIDALYLPPLWALDQTALGQFLWQVSERGIPTFTSEGKLVLERGAFATASYFSIVSEARFNAAKAVRIMLGELPQDLPVSLQGGLGLAVNNGTALKCGIELPENVLSDFTVIEAPPGGEVTYMDLNEAINRASALNPGILAQSDAVHAAAEAARQAYSGYMPHLVGATRITHLDDNTVHNYRDLVSKDGYRSSLKVDQQLFSLETIREIQLASKHRDLANIDFTQTQLDLELAVSLAYLNYLRSEEILNALASNRGVIEHNLELAMTKAQTDEGDTLDVIRLEDERYQATLRVVDARADCKIARVILNALLNLPGNEPLQLDSITFAEESFLMNESRLNDRLKDRAAQQELEERIVVQALELNPAAGRARMQTDLQKSLLARNTARFWPSLSFNASLNFSDWLEESPTFTEEKTTWSVSGMLRLPLFLGSDRFRERSRLKAVLSEMEYRQDEVSLEIMRQIRTEFHSLVAAVTRITPSLQSRKRARQVLTSVVEGYSSGEYSLTDLFNVQANAIDAELSAIHARYAYYEAVARLVHRVGWSVSEDYSNFLERFHLQALD
ncbi:MAG: TolC family protein [Candidatus Zixiibacteriota bacterium]|nr:MAG: TolC family protein [candidate division Zixibacteria bacterium]